MKKPLAQFLLLTVVLFLAGVPSAPAQQGEEYQIKEGTWIMACVPEANLKEEFRDWMISLEECVIKKEGKSGYRVDFTGGVFEDFNIELEAFTEEGQAGAAIQFRGYEKKTNFLTWVGDVDITYEKEKAVFYGKLVRLSSSTAIEQTLLFKMVPKK